MTGDGLFLGLISGTSADGIDAALVAIGPPLRLLAARTHPYPAALRETLLALTTRPEASIALSRIGELDAELGECFATAALELLAAAGIPPQRVRAIGSHGQTVSHRPRGRPPHTLQLGDPARIAERTGITTVADFRRRDVAAGGQGAPLVPAFHAELFRVADEDRAVLNVGGIANLTLLPGDPRQPVRGFDCGPGNALLDAWAMRCLGQPFDRDGRLAASASPDPQLVARMLEDPFFAAAPPKSTGREHFNLAWLATHAPDLASRDPAVVQASVLELAARSCAAALLAHLPTAARVLVCGGGAHNAALMRRLGELLAPRPVTSTAAFGLDPDFVEAAAFAWLAAMTLAGRPGNLPEVTGAAGPRILGAIYPA